MNPCESPSPESQKRNALRSKLLIIAALALYVLIAWLLGLPCPILHFTGIPCPGCGMTRAVFAALKGQWRLALTYHGMVWSLPLLALLFWFEGRLLRRQWLNRLLIALLALGFGIHWIVYLI